MTEQEMKAYDKKTNLILAVEFAIVGIIAVGFLINGISKRYDDCRKQDLNESICSCYSYGNSMEYCLMDKILH